MTTGILKNLTCANTFAISRTPLSAPSNEPQITSHKPDVRPLDLPSATSKIHKLWSIRHRWYPEPTLYHAAGSLIWPTSFAVKVRGRRKALELQDFLGT